MSCQPERLRGRRQHDKAYLHRTRATPEDVTLEVS